MATTSVEVQPLLSARADRDKPRAVRKFRPDIEGLRAVAVISVVLSHLALGFPGGYVGVDVFFVISGFLISRQLLSDIDQRNRVSFRTFYARRVRRILPAATVVIVGTILACREWDSPLRVRSDAVDGLFSAISGINWHLAITGTDYFQSDSPPSPFQHFWSLAVEEQFYVLWPLLLVFIALVVGKRLGRRKSLVWSLLVIMAVSLTLSIVTSSTSPSWAYFGTQTRAWELAFGALVAVTVDVWTKMPPALASQMSWFGLGMIALSVFTYSSSTVYPGEAAVLPVVGAAFVIAGGCPGWSRSGEMVLGLRPMQFIGRVSYSWYLIHWPVLTIAPLALGGPLTIPEKWLVLFGSLALSVVMFYAVERPVRGNWLLVNKPRYALATGSILVAASLVTATLVSDHSLIPTGADNGQSISATANVQAVQEQIIFGAQLRKLPANVVPSLTDAANDSPFTNTCLVTDEVTAPPPTRECTFGDPNGRHTIVMVGDSHANSWSPAVDAFAKANGWRFILLAKAGCPPGVYPSDVDPITNRLYTQCNEWRENIFSLIMSLKPDIVLVASELRTIEIDPSGEVESIRNFQASGAQVIYLEDTPNPGHVGSIPDCLARNPNNVQACSLSRQDPNSRLDAFIVRRTEAAAVKQAGATIIDPTSWFCTATTCPPIINDIVVYMDDSHTTTTYIKWLAPLMSATLKTTIDNIEHAHAKQG